MRAGATLVATLLLAGCASFSPDSGFTVVEQAAKNQLGKDLRWARSDADRDAIDKCRPGRTPCGPGVSI